jgi:3-oxoacyl-[acyl-carrier-protein] synthase-3
MPNAAITGTGSYVPPRVVTNDDLREQYGIDTTHDWIEKRTGIHERRFSDAGVFTSDLGAFAAEQAIESAGIDKRDVDLMILATLSPDHHFPGTGVYMQRRLGLVDGPDPRFVPALDIRNQCSGFVYGLSIAASMVQSGAARHVLLVGAETHSHAIDLSTRGRTICTLFGDGAGAVIVSATDEDRGVRGWTLGTDSRYADSLCQKIWDVSQKTFLPIDEQGRGCVEPEMMWAYMDGKLVFRHAIERMCQALVEVCMKVGAKRDDIDLFCFHQANLRINEYVQKLLEIPADRVVSNVQRYGNTTAATIPILLAEAERSGKLRRGMKVATVAFGSGFTWGAAIIDW